MVQPLSEALQAESVEWRRGVGEIVANHSTEQPSSTAAIEKRRLPSTPTMSQPQRDTKHHRTSQQRQSELGIGMKRRRK